MVPLIMKQISLIYLDSKRTYCVGGRRKSIIIDMIEYEKEVLEQTKKWKFKKENMFFFDVLKQYFLQIEGVKNHLANLCL